MKIIGLGLNYKQCYQDGSYKEPVLFLKGDNTLLFNNGDIIYPEFVDKVWVEAELAIVVNYGFTFANDITAENVDDRDHHLARSKSLDTFCPIFNKIVTFDSINPYYQRYKTYINDKLVQDASTEDMILNYKQVLRFVSNKMKLNSGDIILTGTHPGSATLGNKEHIMTDGIIKKGDIVRIEFPNIGVMENRVI